MASATLIPDDVALSVRGLAKSYTLLSQNPASGEGGAGARLRSLLRRPESRTFWALRGVDLDIRQGDVVGFVGRNGAGKSTLLKVLSRITPPTKGRIALRGRVGSLLEVGTGFHPELTGRENIYLNGSILGMTRREIDRQFDAIVDFAEVAAFLDTPVKRYSSGMYVRLAFAVAAHLDPEILIVDEVLAVGDAAFQKKCLGKMQDVARGGGRTVLFVSHNMAAVRSLCTRAILMRGGQVALDADVDAVVAEYVREGGETSEASVAWDEAASSVPPDADARFVRARILTPSGAPLTGSLDARQGFTIAVEYEVLRTVRNLRIGFGLQNAEGVLVCGSNDPTWSRGTVRAPGRYEVRCDFPGWTLNEGRYSVDFCADIPNERVLHRTGFDLAFSIEDVEGHGDGGSKLPGVLRPRLNWEESEALEDAPAAPSTTFALSRGHEPLSARETV